jgi:hypothetical protein
LLLLRQVRVGVVAAQFRFVFALWARSCVSFVIVPVFVEKNSISISISISISNFIVVILLPLLLLSAFNTP